MSISNEPNTLAKRLDRMISDLSRVVVAANKGRDFAVGALAQNAIAEIGKLRKGHSNDPDDEWAEWIAWPPRAYPSDHEQKGLMEFNDVPSSPAA
jgi:hypothetical protein